MDEKRFEVHKQKGSFTVVPSIIVDKNTGVHYLYVEKGYSGGLTPLLDRDGKPIISPTSSFEEDILK